MSNEISQVSLHQYYAAHCPITLNDAIEIYKLNTGSIDVNAGVLLRYYAEIRFAYADKMLEVGK